MTSVTTRHNASQSVTTSRKGYSLGVTTRHSDPLNVRLWCRNGSRHSHITHGCAHQAASQRFITRHYSSLPVPNQTPGGHVETNIQCFCVTAHRHTGAGSMRLKEYVYCWTHRRRPNRHNPSQRARAPKVSASERVAVSRTIDFSSVATPSQRDTGYALMFLHLNGEAHLRRGKKVQHFRFHLFFSH